MSFTPDYPCTNPSCHSYGRPHPHCKCSAPGEYAQGGAVHYCAHGLPHESSCEYFAEGGEVQQNQEFQNNPDLAIDHAVANHGLLHTLSRTGYSKSAEPGRVHQEFLDSSRKGRKVIESHSNSPIDEKKFHVEHDESRAQALEEKLDELRANPELALNIGGDLADTLPMHHAVLAAKAASAMNYLSSIKPQPTQAGPLDSVIPPSDANQKGYRRQLALAENPNLFYQHAKDGTLIPKDIETLTALYPKLRTHMQDKAFETLASAKMNGKELTHRQKRQFGALVGQRLTFLQTPQAAQAIMHANAPAQLSPPLTKKEPKKATGVELKQINKVNELSATPLQRLQEGRNS